MAVTVISTTLDSSIIPNTQSINTLEVRMTEQENLLSTNVPVIASNTSKQNKLEEDFTTLETTFNALVINAGSSNAEIVVARGSSASLGIRLDGVDTQLANTTTKIDSIDVNVKFPPVGYVACVMDGVTDDTLALQALLDNFTNIFIPKGTLRYIKLTLSSETHISGAGQDLTILTPLPSTELQSVVLAVGPIVYMTIKDLFFYGIAGTNPGQHGLYFKGSPRAVYNDGGIWYGTFSNVIVANFDASQLSLIGGSGTNLPHQFVAWKMCRFVTSSNPTSMCMCQEGQVEQMTWTQCDFSAYGINVTQLAVRFRRVRDDLQVIQGDLGGNGQTFIQCYCGNAIKGVSFERSTNIKWFGGYWENIQKCIDVSVSCQNILISNGNEFRVCGTVGDNTGYLIWGDSGSSNYKFTNNSILGCENINMGGATQCIEGNYLYSSNVSSNYNRVNYTNQDIAGVAGVLQVYSKCSRVGGLPATITTIEYNYGGTEEIILIAWNGIMTLGIGGNINIKANLVLAMKDYVVLMQVDNMWMVKSVVTNMI